MHVRKLIVPHTTHSCVIWKCPSVVSKIVQSEGRESIRFIPIDGSTNRSTAVEFPLTHTIYKK